MRVILAPMQGVLDHLMREVLTSVNDYDLCVSEFIRVVDQLLPAKVFHRLCPELRQDGKTRAGTPVRVQLLGQHPEWLAENAVRAIELGSPGVDLNFGCPAPTVNKSKGGAVLLKEPETVYRIVKAVREAVPAHLPVSAKIRLGYDDKDLYLDNAQAVYQGGANELAVHARTKREGYKAPAHWEYVDAIRRALPIPVTANGEIWNHADALTCARVSGCDALMVGRGAISLPNLANVMKTGCAHMSWAEVLQLMVTYTEQDLASDKADYYPSRIKQWFSYIVREYPQADELFRRIRTIKTARRSAPPSSASAPHRPRLGRHPAAPYDEGSLTGGQDAGSTGQLYPSARQGRFSRPAGAACDRALSRPHPAPHLRSP